MTTFVEKIGFRKTHYCKLNFKRKKSTMRKTLLSSIAIYLLLSTLAVAQNESTHSSSAPEPSTIITDSGLIDFFLNPSTRTWRDLDAFYLNGVEKYQERADLFNFKCAAIQGLTDFYKMLDDSSEEATERIGFFAEEMAGLKNCNPGTLYSMLVRLKSHWERSKISQVASVGYQNATSLFNVLSQRATFDDVEYQKRKKGMEDLASLTEIKD